MASILDLEKKIKELFGLNNRSSQVPQTQPRGLSQRITGKDILPFQQQRQQIGQNVSNFVRQGITNIGNTRLENLPAPNLMPIQKLRSQVKAQPYTPTIREQFTKTIAQPITTAFDKNKSPLDRGIGAVQGAFNSTPIGQAWQIGTGGVAGLLKSRRTGAPLDQSIRQGISNPMADIATEGLGVQNPFLALGINVLSGNPKSAVKGLTRIKGLKQANDISKMVKQGQSLGLTGINPKAFKMHPDDIAEGKMALDILRNKATFKVTPDMRASAQTTIQNLLEGYAPGYKLSKNNKAYQAIEYLINVNDKVPKDLNVKLPKMGFAQADDVLQGAGKNIKLSGGKVMVKPQMQIKKDTGNLKAYTSPGSFTNTRADQIANPLPWETKLPGSQLPNQKNLKIVPEQKLPLKIRQRASEGQGQPSIYPDDLNFSKNQSSRGILSPADEVSQSYAESRTLLGNMGRGGIKGLDDDVRDAFQGWVNTRRATDIEGYLKKKDFSDLDNKGIEGIFEFQAGNKTGRFNDVKKFFDDKYKTLQDEGIDFNYKQDYLPQLWDNTQEELQQVFGKKLGLRPSFTIDSIFKDYEEGIAKGLRPKFNSISDLAGWYEQRANKALADKRFFDFLGKDSFITPANKAPQGWVTLDPDRFPKFSVNIGETSHTGAFKAPPELAKVINNYLRDPQFDLLTNLANYVSRVKNVTLNFGIPGTAINAHGINILARHTLMGTGKNPVSRLLTGVKYMLNPKSSEKELDMTLKKAPKAIKDGLMLSSEDYLGFGKQAQNLAGQFSKKWEDVFATPLFNKMLPTLKLSSYEELVKNGMNGRDAAKLVNNVYGGINWEQMGRSRDAQNLLRSIILAPDWAETTVRIGGNFAKALNPLYKSETANRYRTMMATIMASYVAHNVVNKIISGHYSYENDSGHIFEIEAGYTQDGQKRYIRPYGTALDMVRLPFDIAKSAFKGDFSSIARTFRNRFSIPLGVAVGAVTDENYRGQPIGYRGTDKYGNEIPLAQRVGGIGSEMASLVGFPSFLRQGISTATGQQGIEQGLTQGFELPFRYSTIGNSAIQKQVSDITEGMSGKEKYDFNKSLQGETKFSDNQIEFIKTGDKPNERVQELLNKRAENRKDNEEKEVLKEGGEITQSGGKIRWIDENGSVQSVDLDTKKSKGRGIDAFNEDTSNASKARKIWGAPNDQITPEEKEKAFKALGFTSDEVRYDYMSSDKFSSKERASYIESKNMDHNTLLERLMTGRVESVSGNLFVSNATLDELEDRGLISDAEAKALKKIKFDKNGKDISSASGGKGKKPTKLSLPKATTSKLSIPNIKIGSGSKLPTIKLSSGPVKPKPSPQRTIKIKTPERTISYKVVTPAKVKGLDNSVRLV